MYYRGFSSGTSFSFRGLFIDISVIATTFPATGLYFMSYEESLKRIPGGKDSLLAQFGAGVIAQTCASFVFTPRDVIKVYFQFS